MAEETGSTNNAPGVVELPKTGAEPGQIPLAGIEPGAGDKPKRHRRTRAEMEAARGGAQPAAEKPAITPEAMEALVQMFEMGIRTGSGIMVKLRGDAYKMKEATPETVNADGTKTPAMPAQPRILAQAWAVPLAPYLLSGDSPWGLALVTTAMIVGPMVVQDLTTKRDKKPAEPPPTGRPELSP